MDHFVQDTETPAAAPSPRQPQHAPFTLADAADLRDSMLDQLAEVAQVQAAAGMPLPSSLVDEVRRHILGLSDQAVVDRSNSLYNKIV